MASMRWQILVIRTDPDLETQRDQDRCLTGKIS